MARALAEAEVLALIDALADGGWHSGEALADRAGITRSGLGKRIAHLRDWGLRLETLAGRGYRLEVPLERLDVAKIRRLMIGDLPLRLDVLARTDSTNQRLLEADATLDPQALFAEAQTAGRGRRGRAWQSPFGANLSLSVAWSFDSWPPVISCLPLAIGVACARALHEAGLAEVGLKWPNDLRVGAAKIGGILIEQRGEAGGACRIVAGIGINYAMSAAQASAVDQAWTAVAAELAVRGRAPVSRNILAALLVDAVLAALAEFGRSGFASFAADWAQLDLTAGRPVRIEGPGGDGLQGIARGIDSIGALIVETADGRRQAVHSGDVSLRFQLPAAGTA